MNKIFLFLIPLLLHTGCFHNKKEYAVLELEAPIPIKGQAGEVETFLPSQLEWFNSKLYLFRVNGCTAKIYDEDSLQNIADFGRMGSGPDEFISPYFSGFDEETNRMYVSDISLNVFREYEIIEQKDTVLFKRISSKRIERNDIRFLATSHLKNGFTVAQTIAGTKDMFILFDKEMKIHHTFGGNPTGEDIKDLQIFWGFLTAHGNQIVFAAMNYGYIASYMITDDGESILLWEQYLSRPYFDLQGDKVNWNDDKNKKGFYDVKINDKHIYALYSGKYETYDDRSIPQNLLVFDLKGNLEKHYLLDKASCRIAVAHDSVIYSEYYIPDVGIAKYVLPD